MGNGEEITDKPILLLVTLLAGGLKPEDTALDMEVREVDRQGICSGVEVDSFARLTLALNSA